MPVGQCTRPAPPRPAPPRMETAFSINSLYLLFLKEETCTRTGIIFPAQKPRRYDDHSTGKIRQSSEKERNGEQQCKTFFRKARLFVPATCTQNFYQVFADVFKGVSALVKEVY